jgi:regulator of RNase E activity RraA
VPKPVYATVSQTDLGKIRDLDTCSVSNAIERLNVRLRNEGFISGAARCRFPNLPPMLGYAVMGRIRSSSPPMSGRCYYDRMDFWSYLSTAPEPRVIVIQDVDPRPGFGAFFGEIHANIAKALNCEGYVTNGAVRDLVEVRNLGFHLFSACLSVSHSYAHLIEFGEPVEIGGLKISPGDLLHGDRHGVHSIPLECVASLPAEVEIVRRAEEELIEFCQSPRFSLAGLESKLAAGSKDCS